MKIYYVGKLKHSLSNDDEKFLDIKESNYFIIGDLNAKYHKLDTIKFQDLKDILIKLNTNPHYITKNKSEIEIINEANFTLYDTIHSTDEIIYEIIVDENGNKYGKEIITGLLFPLKINCEISYSYNDNGNHTLKKRETYINENMAKFSYIIEKKSVASLNEIEKYLSKQNNKKSFGEWENKITTMYKENVFKNPIIEKEIEPLEKQSELTKIMEDIEFLLCLLKKDNIELYNKHEDEYKKITKTDNNYMNLYEPSKKDLLNILSNIKLSLIISDQNCDNIIDYLNIVIKKYFIRMQQDKINDVEDLNINDLDNITSMFLKGKDNYDIQTQRSVLKKLSLLYLLTIKTNIDKINVNDLKESYFKENIKTIILHIFTLHDIGIINNNPNINLNKEISVETTFEMIKSLEFYKVQEENAKKLVK